MATIKSYTDLEQSKELAEILPFESSDMCYPPYHIGDEDGDHLYYSLPLLEYKEKCAYNRDNKDEYIPCWSLAALLGVLPDEITDDGVYRNMFFHLKGKYIIQYPRLTTLWPSLLSAKADNPVDACYEMILKLHELNLL